VWLPNLYDFFFFLSAAWSRFIIVGVHRPERSTSYCTLSVGGGQGSGGETLETGVNTPPPDRPLAITLKRSRNYFEFKGTFTFFLCPQRYISFIL
jgi:hypothetical protein